MAKDKKVEQITDMDVDFAQWFTDVCTKAELIDYSSIKGMYIMRPYGYAIWENIQHILDAEFKALGHENVYLPMLIPESLLQKEKDHVEGFAPECAWVTYGGSDKLEERYCIRPTSETLFCEHYKNVIHSWRDLPKLYNQWCSVLRWEKTSRPFLRHREFLWQEGHTMHESEEEARAETQRMLNVYADFMENTLAMPVIRGRKTDKEKFNGAEETYTVECMMHDHKALQGGTSHYFGDGFAKAFDITYTGKDNQLHHPYQTSWGVSVRMIGGIIMTHGDNSGLVLPPKIAPTQVIVVPVAMHKEGVREAAEKLLETLKNAGIRAGIDLSDQSMGWKAAQKLTLPLENIADSVKALLDEVQKELYAKALKNLQDNTFDAHSVEEVRDGCANGGFARMMWCGDEACEVKMKEQAGVTSRCIPFEQQHIGDVCPVCGKPAKHMVIWGIAY